MEALIWCIEALSSTHIIGWIYFANNIVLMQIFPSHIWLQNTFVPTPILSLCTMPHVWILDFLEQQLPLLSCFLSKEIKTFGKQNSFHLEDEVKTPRISIWISWVFLCGFPLHIFSNFHYSAIRADAANHHRVDIHSLMWKARLVKWKFGGEMKK